MRYPRLNDLPSGYRLVLGLGAATTLAAGAVLFIGTPPVPRSPHQVHSPGANVARALVAKAAVGAPAANPTATTPAPAVAQIPTAQAVLMKAKFAGLTPGPLVGGESPQAPPPAAPEVVGVAAAAAAPAPQPMEASVQTAEAPAPTAAAPARPVKVSYFGGGSSSIQHLPIASR